MEFHKSGDDTFKITSHPVTGLDNKTYIEYRLERRDVTGRLFRGYEAFGSRAFCEQALIERTSPTFAIAGVL